MHYEDVYFMNDIDFDNLAIAYGKIIANYFMMMVMTMKT